MKRYLFVEQIKNVSTTNKKIICDNVISKTEKPHIATFSHIIIYKISHSDIRIITGHETPHNISLCKDVYALLHIFEGHRHVYALLYPVNPDSDTCKPCFRNL